MKKPILILLLLVLYTELSIAQTIEKARENLVNDVFKRSEFIAEGILIELKDVISKDSAMIHSLGKFKIFHVFKSDGKVKDGDTVNLLCESRAPGELRVDGQKYRQYKGMIGTLFFKNNYPYDLLEKTIYKKYELLNDHSEFLVSYSDYNALYFNNTDFAATGLFKSFKKISDFYEFLKTQGLQIPNECFSRLTNFSQKRVGSNDLSSEEIEKNKERLHHRWDSGQANIQRKLELNSQNVNARLQDENDVTTFYFRNTTLKTVGSKSYFDFDVYISNNSFSHKYVETAQFDLEYGAGSGCNGAFSCNLASNNKITVTLGSDFTKYYTLPFVQDKTGSKINIGVQNSYDSQSKFFNTYVDDTPKKCLSPLNSWTKFEKQFCNNLNLGNEQSKKKIYRRRTSFDHSGIQPGRFNGDMQEVQSFPLPSGQVEKALSQ